MPSDDYRLRIGIDWSLAERDTAAFINRVNGEIKRLLAAAQNTPAAGRAAASQSVGSSLAQLQTLLATGNRQTVAGAAGANLSQTLAKLGYGGSRGLVGLHALFGDSRNAAGSSTIGRSQAGNINVEEFRRGYVQSLAQQDVLAATERARASAAASRGLNEVGASARAAGTGLRQAGQAARANAPATRFQQLYARTQQPRGGVDFPASQAPTLGRFLGSRALTTVGYGLSGGLLYGAISGARELVREATELEVELGILESQFDSFGGSVNGITFDTFKDEILDVSRLTATQADIVAATTRQLAGALATVEDGVVTPDYESATGVATTALGLSRITGLPEREITDSFSATLLAFNEEGGDAEETARRIADAVVGLEARFGVASTEILDFTASLASLGAAGGFTVEQLAGLGAVVEQAVGSDVAASENIGRIFAGLQDKRVEVLNLLNSGGLGDFVEPLASALASNDLPEALRQLVSIYEQIDSSSGIGQELGNIIAGPRNARTFFAVLERGPQILNALDTEAGDFTGSFDDRFQRVTETVSFSFDEMQRAVEKFGLALFESGLADGLESLASIAVLFATAAEGVLNVFRDLNDALEGLPAKLLLAAAAWKAYNLASGFAGGVRGGRGIPGGTGVGFAAGSLLSPYGAGAGPNVAPALNPRLVGGGAITRVAQSGSAVGAGRLARFGAGAAGFAASAAPIIAGVALFELGRTTDQIAGELDAERQSLRDQVQAEIEAGTDPDEIRNRLEGSQSSTRDDITYGITSGFGLFGSSTDPYSEAIDAIQEAEAERIINQLEALNAYYVGQGEQDSSSFIEAFAADPANNDLRGMADEIIQNAIDNDSGAADTLVTVLGVETVQDTIAKGLARRADSLRKETAEIAGSVSDLSILYQAGEVDVEELEQALQEQIDLWQGIFDSEAEAGRVDIEAAQTLIDGRAQLEAIQNEASAARQQRFSTALEVTSSLTGGDLNAQLGVLQGQLAEVTDPEDRLGVALQIRDVERQLLEEQASQIDDLGERIAFLQSGLEGDPAANVEILIAQVEQVDPVWRAFLEANFGSVEASADLVRRVAEISVAQGISFAEAYRREIENALAAARILLSAAKAIRNKVLTQAFGTLAEGLQGQLEAIPTLPDIPSIGNVVGSPSQIADLQRQQAEQAAAAADKARQEAMARELANLDIAAARADGNSIELARIARRRAEVNYRFAESDSERLQAYAQMIEADNQLNDAFVARNQAFRDFANAWNGDDSVKVAENAVNAAQEQVAIASGEAEYWTAIAAEIRASQGLAEAIQQLGDSQIDILIAMAEAGGRSVEAAQLAAQKIRDRIANSNALGLGQAERNQLDAQLISAEAAVRDARFAEERETIQYQLEIGQITKQQAIGALQSLLTIPDLTEKQIRDINLEIKRLRESLGADYKFNLPTELGLPTVYEVRRLGQSGGTGGSYQDNRNISVTVYADTNASPELIATQVANVIGDPRRDGTTPRRY